MNTAEKAFIVGGYALGTMMRPGLELTILGLEITAGLYLRLRGRRGR